MSGGLRTRGLRGLLIVALALSLPGSALAWDHWGGDSGGQRFSDAAQITSANVANLVKAWDFSTGDLAKRPPEVMARTKSEATPLFVENSLVMCTPFNEVIALDPGTGVQKWRFDPHIDMGQYPANRFNCRGVTYWIDEQAPPDAACRSRILMGTNDARVIALDAKNGTPCSDFGANGEVRFEIETKLDWPGEFQITSPPVVSRGVVIVGSAISDNRRVEAPRGSVRAFDVRTGRALWSWDPLIHDGIQAGATNVWAPMSADDNLGLVFLPTSSPSPDFFGGKRPGNNDYANSVVALRSETGERVWSYQAVHHDVWDYDLPAQPTLARLDTGNGARDVVIQATKQGFLFVLDRATGAPIWPVQERSVPQGGVAGEQLSPTQPFPTHVPALAKQSIAPDDALWLPSFLGGETCRAQLAALRNEGLYTPPSTQGTVLFPMTGGGVNWGGVAFDSVNQILYANVSAAVNVVKLIPADQTEGMKSGNGRDFGPQRGAAFAMVRTIATSKMGLLCNPPPWGSLVAVDLKAGKIRWRSSVGTTEDKAPLGMAFNWGSPVLNGVVVTAGRLVFTGALDAYLRAFDAADGTELWQGRLPAPGVANPMTYTWNGEQYVAIVAGGHSEAGSSIGDGVVAFRLPRNGEAPSLRSRTIDRPGGRFQAAAVAAILVVACAVMFALVWRARRRQRRRVTPS